MTSRLIKLMGAVAARSCRLFPCPAIFGGGPGPSGSRRGHFVDYFLPGLSGQETKSSSWPSVSALPIIAAVTHWQRSAAETLFDSFFVSAVEMFSISTSTHHAVSFLFLVCEILLQAHRRLKAAKCHVLLCTVCNHSETPRTTVPYVTTPKHDVEYKAVSTTRVFEVGWSAEHRGGCFVRGRSNHGSLTVLRLDPLRHTEVRIIAIGIIIPFAVLLCQVIHHNVLSWPGASDQRSFW